MAAPSAQEPFGWDDDPAWSRPDPAAEREAWLDHLVALDDPFDLEEYPDPEDCVPLPGEDRLTAEELAGIREAARDLAAAEAGTAAEMARLGGTLGAIAAMAVRRGPGQPGSARVPAGESSGRAAAFGTGMALDVMPACPELALAADAAVGRMTVTRVPRMRSWRGCCARGTGWRRTWRRGSWPRRRS